MPLEHRLLGDGLGEGDVGRSPGDQTEVELVRDRDRAGQLALLAARAPGGIDVGGLLRQPHPEGAQAGPGDVLHLGVGQRRHHGVMEGGGHLRGGALAKRGCRAPGAAPRTPGRRRTRRGTRSRPALPPRSGPCGTARARAAGPRPGAGLADRARGAPAARRAARGPPAGASHLAVPRRAGSRGGGGGWRGAPPAPSTAATTSSATFRARGSGVMPRDRVVHTGGGAQPRGPPDRSTLSDADGADVACRAVLREPAIPRRETESQEPRAGDQDPVGGVAV